MLNKIKIYLINKDLDIFIVFLFLLISLYANLFLPKTNVSQFQVLFLQSQNSQIDAKSALEGAKADSFLLAQIVNSDDFKQKLLLHNNLAIKNNVNLITGSLEFTLYNKNGAFLIEDTKTLFNNIISRFNEILFSKDNLRIVTLKEPYILSYIPIYNILISLFIGLIIGILLILARNKIFHTKNHLKKISLIPNIDFKIDLTSDDLRKIKKAKKVLPPYNLPVVSY